MQGWEKGEGQGQEDRVGGCFLLTVYLLSSLSPPLPFQDPLESWIRASDSSFLTEENVQVHPGGDGTHQTYLMLSPSSL